MSACPLLSAWPRACAGLAPGLLVAGLALADLAPARYPWRKSLTPPAERVRGVATFLLDEEVFAVADAACANLRLVADGGGEVPYLVRRQTRAVRVIEETRVPVATEALRELADNRLELVVRIPAAHTNRTFCAVRLESRQTDFEKEVVIEGSADRQQWEPLGAGGAIFDYTRFINLRNEEVPFGPSRHPYYRLRIGNITESQRSPFSSLTRERREGVVAREEEHLAFQRRDFRMDAVVFVERAAVECPAQVATQACSTLDFACERDARRKETVVTFKTHRVPLTHVTLDTVTDNFNREVVLETPGAAAGSEWQWICSGTLRRIHLGGVTADTVTLALPGACRAERYRLRIRDMDSPPLEIRGVRLAGEVWAAVFLAEPEPVYHILYGGEGADAPRYDLGAVLAQMPSAAPAVFTPGAQAAHAAYRGGSGRAPVSARTVLVVAIVAAVGVLGWLIVLAVRNVETLGGRPPPTDGIAGS